jgi:hypothetical protein
MLLRAPSLPAMPSVAVTAPLPLSVPWLRGQEALDLATTRSGS